jgi:RNA polymerase sigma factor (sigma-70 family)
MKNKNGIVIEDYMPLAFKLAGEAFRRQQAHCIEQDEFRSVALLALTQAADYYDPEKGSFATAVHLMIRGAFQVMYRKTYETEKRLNLRYESASTKVFDDVYDNHIEAWTDESPSVLDSLIEFDDYKLLYKHLDKLSVRRKYIIEQRYLVQQSTAPHGVYAALSAIAKDLGVSRQRVQQLETTALASLKESVQNEISS